MKKQSQCGWVVLVCLCGHGRGQRIRKEGVQVCLAKVCASVWRQGLLVMGVLCCVGWWGLLLRLWLELLVEFWVELWVRKLVELLLSLAQVAGGVLGGVVVGAVGEGVGGAVAVSVAAAVVRGGAREGAVAGVAGVLLDELWTGSVAELLWKLLQQWSW